MSPRVRRFGSITVLMWMVGLFMFPVVAYVANNAIKIPTVLARLEDLIGSQHRVENDLSELSKINSKQHLEIMRSLRKHEGSIKALEIRCNITEKRVGSCDSIRTYKGDRNGI